MKKVVFMLVVVVVFALAGGCSQGACEVVSSSSMVRDVSVSSSAPSVEDSSLQPLDVSSDVAVPFYIGNWEYIPTASTIDDEAMQDRGIVFSFAFNEEQTVKTWVGYRNSNLISSYEGSYSAQKVESGAGGYVLTLELKQLYYGIAQYKSEQDIIEMELKIVPYGPEYRVVFIFTSGDPLYGEHVTNSPYWYVLV